MIVAKQMLRPIGRRIVYNTSRLFRSNVFLQNSDFETRVSELTPALENISIQQESAEFNTSVSTQQENVDTKKHEQEVVTTEERNVFRPMSLRDYQEDAVNSVLNAIDDGFRRIAVVIATGGGKTVVFSHLIPLLNPSSPERGNKTLVLVHTQELVAQATHKIRAINPNLKVEIEMRNLRASPEADVVVASVPSLARKERLQRFDPMEYKTIIVDECHHALAASWKKILMHFQANTNESEAYVVGFTATLKRGDSAALGSVFDTIAYERSLETMIRNNELADVDVSQIRTNLSGVGIRRGDYDQKELSKQMQANVQDISVAYLELQSLGYKRTLMFCVDVINCILICEYLQKLGVNAQYVTGETDKTERQMIIEDFMNGEIQVLCNVMVFTEGTDIPAIDSIILARPTLSETLKTQMIGRGLRLYEGKTRCHIVDLVDATKHGISVESTLNDRGETKEVSGGGNDLKEKPRPKVSEEILERIRQFFKEHMYDFETRHGIENVVKITDDAFEDDQVVTQFLKESKGYWMRLEEDVWGVPLLGLRFALLGRERRSRTVKFEISVYESVKYNKNKREYKPQEHIQKVETLGEGANLARVYNQYLASRYPYQRAKQRRKNLTDAQIRYIMRLNLSEIHYYSNRYNLNSEDLQKFFEQEVESMSYFKGSYFLVALVYSVDSIYARHTRSVIFNKFKSTYPEGFIPYDPDDEDIPLTSQTRTFHIIKPKT